MRMSKAFGKTSKNEGADYKIDSHRLLTQGGFIRESTAGRYFMLPLGQKVHKKIENIIRKHMDNASAQEVLMPILHPLELWKETNRTTTVSFELMKIKDRRGAEFALGGTAEEMAVDLVRKFNISYKDLPFNIYQFSMKFRDEMRARGGLLRVREFVMKDAYSFSTEAQFKEIYQKMWDAYKAIFDELGLKTDVVAADNGYIGGEYCHEFVAQAEAGESRYFIEEGSDYAAHEDVAIFKIDQKNVGQELAELTEVDAVRNGSMQDGVNLHKMPLWQQIKDVLYYDQATDCYILAIIRGDLDVNETKLMHLANAWELRMATNDEVREELSSEPGFISPVNFAKQSESGKKVVIVADKSLRTICNAYGGANKKHRDLLNVNIDRDYQPDVEGDIAMTAAGMIGPNGGKLIEKRGIEVGNIFQLGWHYTNLMQDAEFTEESGKRQKYYMGCYGIGVGRTLAAIVEANHDERGIKWPASVAPYQVYLARLGDSQQVVDKSDQIYQELQSKGVDVLYDDRNVRPGEKFADADLIGLPHRVVISEKTIAENVFEYKARSSKEVLLLSVQELLAKMV